MKTYTVWYEIDEDNSARIFVSDVTSLSLAERIADNLMLEMSSVVTYAWVEED